MDVLHLVLLATRLPEDGDDDEAGWEDDDGADDADEELAQRELERPQPQRLKRQYVRTISVSACNFSTLEPSMSVTASSIRHIYQRQRLQCQYVTAISAWNVSISYCYIHVEVPGRSPGCRRPGRTCSW